MFEYNYERLSRIARSEVGQKYMQQLKSEYEKIKIYFSYSHSMCISFLLLWSMFFGNC